MADLDRPWTTRRSEKRRRLDRLGLAPGSKIAETDRIDEVLSSLIQPDDRVSLEGDNQKQADFLARKAPWIWSFSPILGHRRPFRGAKSSRSAPMTSVPIKRAYSTQGTA